MKRKVPYGSGCEEEGPLELRLVKRRVLPVIWLMKRKVPYSSGS